ncbi:MAG: copper amine oxidase N-terminal domain-containing protein [Methanobacterium sp.]
MIDHLIRTNGVLIVGGKEMTAKRNKVLSVVMTVCFILTLLMPTFITHKFASASSIYKVLSCPTVITGNAAKDLGAIKITLDDTAAAANSIVTVSMPSDLSFTANGASGVKVYTSSAAAAAAGDKGIVIVAPGGTGGLVPADFASAAGFRISPNKTFDIKMAASLTTIGESKYFFIYFNGVDLHNYNGDIKVNMRPPSGSVFSYGQDLLIAQTTSTGSTLTDCKKVVDLTDAGGDIDIITVMEQVPDTFTGNDYIKLEILTNGFKFDTDATDDQVSYGWNFADNAVIAGDLDTIGTDMFSSNDQLLTYPVQAGVANVNTPGKIDFMKLSLIVDDGKVKAGDQVEIRVSGTHVSEQIIVVAAYVDYGVAVEAGSSKDLIAGHASQTIGDFFITEGAPRSILLNGILSLTLPAGCEWDAVNTGVYENTTSGNVVFNGGTSSYPTLTDSNRVLKWKVTTQSSAAAKVRFKDFKIDVSPDFVGPVEVAVKGSAGAEGIVKVAEVKPAATLAVEKVVDIEYGKPNQQIADIIIAEGALKAILDNTAPGNVVSLELSDGYRFANLPKLEVVEGDIDIDADSVFVNDGRVTFNIEGQSAKTASKIKLSGVSVNVYMTAMAGPVKLSFTKGVNALNETGFTARSAGSTVIANCVQPVVEQDSVAEFRINSNIYKVNGIAKVMDAAPYIKDGRTYVPVRYLAYALGVAESDVIWDAASRKVLMSKGDRQVELVIGSRTIKVNGAASTMEVAPEIVNGRTMLPARYVAEGLGYVVGWDPGTGTVLISK